MHWIKVDTDRCKSDGVCVAVCPARILFLNEKGFPEDMPEGQCILCGHCAAVCAHDALTHTGLPEETFLPIAKEPLPPALMDGVLMSRRSVREFKDRPVSRQVLEALLEVARRAPTASNSQKLHWIVVEGVGKVRALSEEAMNWFRTTDLPKARLEQWEKGHDFILRGAPAVIVACAPADYVWAKQDCAIALTFLELAAEARGFGVCWAGYLTRAAGAHPPLCKALSVPEGYVICGGLMIGECKYAYKKIPPRKPLSVQWI